MKAHLMFEDADFDPAITPPLNERDLTEDLELDALLDAMSGGDRFLTEIARAGLFASLTDQATILYRQAVLKDCLQNSETVRALFAIAQDAIREEKRTYGWGAHSPSTVLHLSITVLEMFSGRLRTLRDLIVRDAGGFHSDGFRRLNQMLIDELSDDYFDEIADHLKTLRFRKGVLISAQLGVANKGAQYVLRRPLPGKAGWFDRLRSGGSHSLTIPDRDESGFSALTELQGRGVNLVADALARSTDHILSFFTMLRDELAFYIGALNLHAALTESGMRVCFPVPGPADAPLLNAEGLYDPCLSLITRSPVVGNDIALGDRPLLIVTGANQGGKSTFLRSVGTAQLMMQCGLFVAADRFDASIRQGVFTHFRREEDTSMVSGKLEEELTRMRDLGAGLRPGSLLLCNESFASTNEREGSEIARQVTRAAIAAEVTVVFVTHLYDFAESIQRDPTTRALFLRADREFDGSRRFQLIQGEPLPTAFGRDVFDRIFPADNRTVPTPRN
jgi:DNA mismatch repair ATPase MutS